MARAGETFHKIVIKSQFSKVSMQLKVGFLCGFLLVLSFVVVEEVDVVVLIVVVGEIMVVDKVIAVGLIILVVVVVVMLVVINVGVVVV